MRSWGAALQANAIPLRWMDSLGVLLVVGIASITYWENVQAKHRVMESLDQVGARSYRNAHDEIYSVAVNDKRLSGSDVLKQISKLRSLENVSLSRSVLPQEELVHFSKLKLLRSLSLYDTNASDTTLRHLSACSAIEVLSLDGTRISDDGIPFLSNLRQLKYLSLARTDVGDECISTIADLPSIIEVDLRNTRISRHGVKRLRLMRPDCQFNFI